MTRRISKVIKVGSIYIGGAHPVSIQSMTNTDTRDTAATLSQIDSLAAAGCQMARIAIPDMDAARAVYKIKEKSPLPIVADIHFDYRLAIEAANAGADKLRVNPGNIGDNKKMAEITKACRKYGIPIRVGVNGGSLEKDILARYGEASPAALTESALKNVELLRLLDFDDICVSIKSSSVPVMIATYRMFANLSDVPLHLGVTETGTAFMGTVKSAIGVGSLLCDGIGDTVRISLTADPLEEVKAARAILQACGIRKDGINFISCPTCGRCRVNLMDIAAEVEDKLQNVTKSITVAVMGCEVNGPGEARAADFGIACGNHSGVLFANGEIIRKVPEESLVDELVRLISNA